MKHMLQPIYSNTLARKFPLDQLRGTLTFLIAFRKARIISTNIRIRMKCSGIVLGLDLVSILTIETVWGFLYRFPVIHGAFHYFLELRLKSTDSQRPIWPISRTPIGSWKKRPCKVVFYETDGKRPEFVGCYVMHDIVFLTRGNPT